MEAASSPKIQQLNARIGMVYSGMGPDYRVLVKSARKAAAGYFRQYQVMGILMHHRRAIIPTSKAEWNGSDVLLVFCCGLTGSAADFAACKVDSECYAGVHTGAATTPSVGALINFLYLPQLLIPI